MTEMIVWAFFVIVQVHGGVGAGFASEDMCKEARAELLRRESVVSVSECTPLTLHRIEGEKRTI